MLLHNPIFFVYVSYRYFIVNSMLGIISSGFFTYLQTECMSEEFSRFKILDLALKDLTWAENLVWALGNSQCVEFSPDL